MKNKILTALTLTTSLIIFSCGSPSDNTSEQKNPPADNMQPSSEPAPAQEVQPDKKETEWVKIKSWKGNGLKKTEKFSVEGDWRIVWSFNAPQDMTIFNIAYYRPGTEEPEDYVANVSNELKANDTSYVHTSGEFYLEINAANCKWNVSIEQEREKK